MSDLAIDLVFRWMHILAAIILLGGNFFLRFALAPSLARATAETRQSTLLLWRPGWARLVMITSGLLLLSGLFNGVRNIIRFEYEAPYHGLVAVKLLLGLGMFYLSAVLAGRSASAEKAREKMISLLNVNILLGILTVALAGYMRFAERTPKAADATTSTRTLSASQEPSP